MTLHITRRIATLTLLASIFLGTFVWAGTQFTEANTQYQSGNFKEAVALYEELIQQGEASAAVYYNLANAYFRGGKKAEALVNYERALAIAPRDADIRWNIAILKSILPDRLEPKDDNVFVLWIREFVDKFTINEISMVLTLILALWTFWALISFIFPNLRIWLGGIQGATLISLIVVVVFFAFKWQEVRHPRVVVLEKEINVRYGPSNRETRAFALHEGAEGTVIDETADWYNVMLVDKNSGWIPKKSCELI